MEMQFYPFYTLIHFLHTFFTVLLIHWTVVAMRVTAFVHFFIVFIFQPHVIGRLLKTEETNVMCETETRH